MTDRTTLETHRQNCQRLNQYAGQPLACNCDGEKAIAAEMMRIHNEAISNLEPWVKSITEEVIAQARREGIEAALKAAAMWMREDVADSLRRALLDGEREGR